MLIDPVDHGADPLATLAPVAEVLATDEWVLHAADQDLPCLAEIGMRPPKLYDTELAGRLAGYDRVNLATMVQRLLGLQLKKGHGAADWSKRPLPPEWLNYAALDVEVLLELRDAIAAFSRSRASPNGRHRNSSTCAPLKRRRPDGTGGGARRASTRCATRGRWRPCASCGRPVTTSLAGAISRQAGSCPTPRSSTPPPPTPTPSRSSPRCRYSAGLGNAAAPRYGWMRWPGPAQRDPPDAAGAAERAAARVAMGPAQT